MNKKLIRLTESDLHKIIKESVNRILNDDEVFNSFMKSKEQQIAQLKKMIPYLSFLSPEERQEVEADMKRYGINPRM